MLEISSSALSFAKGVGSGSVEASVDVVSGFGEERVDSSGSFFRGSSPLTLDGYRDMTACGDVPRSKNMVIASSNCPFSNNDSACKRRMRAIASV